MSLLEQVKQEIIRGFHREPYTKGLEQKMNMVWSPSQQHDTSEEPVWCEVGGFFIADKNQGGKSVEQSETTRDYLLIPKMFDS